MLLDRPTQPIHTRRKPPTQAPCPVLPGPPGSDDPRQRQEVLPTSAAPRATAAARHVQAKGAAGDQRLPGAGAEQRMAGRAVLPTMRQQPLVPHHQTRCGAAHGALGTKDLWEQVAHVDPTAANPTVSEYTRHNARRNAIKRVDGKRFFD